ncbi:hypothetical protein BKP35_17635 [Anaerobacillus arseniciselenatis]|uniref:ATP synthase F(0) sector subunit c n=1 Tax=Anaerobacillus arseniciselenatis TaxID=85682 RepID=A0A1S2L8E3_9BACI|nr:hypothetical protein [Anaerobacillus arseniciselenatis]OIJ08540.1 hypothetical protein BKP35_17635 [Anaerobacillus arseniciselenatis]
MEILLLIAAIIGVFGILIVYKLSMAKIVEAIKQKDYKTVNKVQTQMFVRIAIVEVIPVILIVIAILDMF